MRVELATECTGGYTADILDSVDLISVVSALSSGGTAALYYARRCVRSSTSGYAGDQASTSQ